MYRVVCAARARKDSKMRNLKDISGNLYMLTIWAYRFTLMITRSISHRVLIFLIFDYNKSVPRGMRVENLYNSGCECPILKFLVAKYVSH